MFYNIINRNSLIALSALLLIAHLSFAQQKNITITFSLHSADLPDTAAVYICGGTVELGNWNPALVKMKNEGNHTWTKKITLPAATSIEYKYTRGSWGREGGDASGAPLPNFSANATKDTVINNTVSFWLNRNIKKEFPHHITGTVRHYYKVTGKGLLPRDMVVWLPPGYDSTKSERYPVLYMHDGQNIFDPATSSFGVEWGIDETCDSLIKARAIPPIIVVGLYCTAQRSKEYSPFDSGAVYEDFLIHKIKPMIDSIYHTKRGPENTFVGGSSMGGIISFAIVWDHPEVFSHAICMSPAFVHNKYDYVKTIEDYNGPRKNVFFYIDIGGIGLETELKPGVEKMLKVLAEKGYVEGKDYVYVSDPVAKHFEAAWAKRFPGAIKSCFIK